MKNYSKLILNKLIDKYEKSSLYKGDNKVNVNIYFKFNKKELPNYYNELEFEYKENINEECINLENKDYIKIHWKKYQENNIIEKVKLNIEKLDEIYNYLNRVKKSSLEEETINLLNNYLYTNTWIDEFLKDMIKLLKEKRSVKKYLDIENQNLIKDLIRGVIGVVNQKTEIPKRVLSIKLFNDSKKLEKIENKIKRIMIDYGNFNPDIDVFSESNVIKNPTYIYLKGKGILKINNETIDLEKLNGEIGLSSSLIEKLEIKSLNVKKVITIENLTAFHFYNVNNELIIYLGGYHNFVRRNLLKKIYDFNNKLTFYHWSDIDLGGFRIINHLREKAGILFKPYLMDKKTLIKYREKAMAIDDDKYTKELEKLLSSDEYKEFHEVIDYMIKNKIRLEQEGILNFY
ncbi:Wadjet anti-phage system protein JetD domain-containing protein [Tepidibacter formicigenes]|jgi:hypothetical protein|uniref:Wadjet protein JetD C-terminal domain-containing protein n=1 Tax=Tepidibacter formicigenes DSM 15518 TaxID=1123349 RepID=A0A1M6RFF0_9FIRM|nr:Wadjet anti-phage system protein JetD domain-containing protein [Tepidibacter formicigenes]SHK31189.1 hypothetical protein SAMN02744037_02098 [Tepidibacter formicigenes DSM 15518]